jgi:hypothetical protein
LEEWKSRNILTIFQSANLAMVFCTDPLQVIVSLMARGPAEDGEEAI